MSPICGAILKNGDACPYKAKPVKFGGFCGYHCPKNTTMCLPVLEEREEIKPLKSEEPDAQKLMKEIEAILKTVHLNKQYRDKTKKVKFNLGWAFLLGNTTNALGAGAFTTPHNFKKGKGVCIKPVEERKLPQWKQDLWRLSKDLMRLIDPDYVEGEYLVNYSCMTDPNHYVRKHTDSDDISYQYALALGDYEGAKLRAYDANDQVLGDFDYHNKICKMDGRLPHEVILEDFSGTRFCVIWFKSYDHRKPQCDPIFDTPCYV